jgi:DNA-binding response OmpR family regulator
VESAVPAPHTVLVVEDDPALRRLLVGALSRDGHAVVGLESGGACSRWVEEQVAGGGPRPSLVLSDVRMPGGGGLELLDRLAASFPGLPVLLMTAFGDADVHLRARRAGAVGVLDKPVDVDLLRARVRALLVA